MLTQPLPQEERISMGATHRIQILEGDLTQAAANTAQVIKLLDLPIGSLVRNVYVVTHQRFEASADPAFNATGITIGDSGTANLFVSATETNKNGAAVRFKTGTGTQKAYDVADVLNITFSSMAAKALANLDKGELWVFVELLDASTYDGGNI